jgi:hypothetical protein
MIAQKSKWQKHINKKLLWNELLERLRLIIKPFERSPNMTRKTKMRSLHNHQDHEELKIIPFNIEQMTSLMWMSASNFIKDGQRFYREDFQG